MTYDEEKNNKPDELAKGSLQRKLPFNPKTDVNEAHRERLKTWVQDATDRSQVPRLEGNARQRAIHHLSSQAITRKNKETGEREFLMFRGKTAFDAKQNDKLSGLTSFSTDPNEAGDFNHGFMSDQSIFNVREKYPPHHPLHQAAQQAVDAGNADHGSDAHRAALQNFFDTRAQHFGGMYTSWVPESAIHHVPNAVGQEVGNKIHRNKFHEEQEIIVDSNHPKFKYDKLMPEHYDMVRELHRKHTETMKPYNRTKSLVNHAVGSVQPKYKLVKSEIEAWVNDRIKNQPSAKDLIKGLHGDWKKEGYRVGIDHESTWSPKKGIQEFHVVAHSPAGKEVGRYVFHHHGDKGLRVSNSDTHDLHQRKGLASEAYRLIEHHTGMQVQPDSLQTDAAQALWANPNKPFGMQKKEGTVNLEHYSAQPGLETIDPKFHGTGIKGEESKRKLNPDWVDRSYHYLAGTAPESTVGALPHKYHSQVQESHIYDYQKDPLKLKQKSMWGVSLDRNLYEKNIKDAGFHGYVNHAAPGMGSVVALFHPVKVNQVNKSEQLSKAIDKDEFHMTIDHGRAKTDTIVDHKPHMKLDESHAQYIKELHDPNVKLPSGIFSEGVSPKLVHKTDHGTYMIKPFHEDATDVSGLATMTAKHMFNAGGIGHLNEDVSATALTHPENANYHVPVVVSKFNPNVTSMYRVSADKVDPKESAQVMIMDYLLGNQDRHGSNSMVQVDKQNDNGHFSPLAIDHSFGFSYNDANGSLQDIINDSDNADGFGGAARLMTPQHKSELADWYKEHGDKIHDAAMKSIDSVKDKHTKEFITRNFKARHNELKEWAKGPVQHGPNWGIDQIATNTFEHPTGGGIDAVLEQKDFGDVKSIKDLEKLHGMFEQHNPSGYRRHAFFSTAGSKLNDIDPHDLVNYFTNPVDEKSDFKNELLHSMANQYRQHPQLPLILANVLQKNKEHPDHAKPVYPFTQKFIENKLAKGK